MHCALAIHREQWTILKNQFNHVAVGIVHVSLSRLPPPINRQQIIIVICCVHLVDQPALQ